MDDKKQFFQALEAYKDKFGEELPTMEIQGGMKEITAIANTCIKQGKPYVSKVPEDCLA